MIYHKFKMCSTNISGQFQKSVRDEKLKKKVQSNWAAIVDRFSAWKSKKKKVFCSRYAFVEHFFSFQIKKQNARELLCNFSAIVEQFWIPISV